MFGRGLSGVQTVQQRLCWLLSLLVPVKQKLYPEQVGTANLNLVVFPFNGYF